MTDEQEIQATIQVYFDCMFESDGDKARQAFHPNASIAGVGRSGALVEMTAEGFANFVASQQPSMAAKGASPVLNILSIEVAGETAVARVRDDYLGQTYLDTLSLLRTEGTWRIYNKLFHIEGATPR